MRNSQIRKSGIKYFFLYKLHTTRCILHTVEFARACSYPTPPRQLPLSSGFLDSRTVDLASVTYGETTYLHGQDFDFIYHIVCRKVVLFRESRKSFYVCRRILKNFNGYVNLSLFLRVPFCFSFSANIWVFRIFLFFKKIGGIA